jgi:hypothetical protein
MGHSGQVGTRQVPTGQQLGHTMTQHRPLHNGMQSFSQPNLTSNMPNMPVNEPLNASLENVDGGDSIDQLIEDIVDRDMPQGVGEAVMFSSTTHGVPLSNQHQHQSMHHVMSQNTTLAGQNQRSSSPNQMSAMVRSPSSGTGGSPLAGGGQVPSGKPLGTNMPHANSPLSQNPASPIKAPSPQMPQYKTSVPLRAARGAKKTTVKLPNLQQPHSPQNMAMGVTQGQVHSPRPTPQRRPQQPGNAQIPPSAANSIISQNMSSPLAQMSPLASGASQALNSQVMGNIGVQHSPVASPLNISSPQSQRPSRQASPGLCNLGSPVPPVGTQDFSKTQSAGLSQVYMTQGNAAKVPVQQQNNLQTSNNLRQSNITQSNVVRTQASVQHQPASNIGAQNNGGTLWTQNEFVSTHLQRPVNDIVMPTQINVSSQGHLPLEQGNIDVPSNLSMAQQRNSVPLSTASQPTSMFDTATVLRGLNALKGTNVIPVALKQGANNQQLQAVKLPNNAANIDLLKQAMLLKAGGQGGSGQGPTTGKPMSINTSQGQVFYYILPKGTNISSSMGSTALNTSGQQVQMVLINTKSVSGNTSVKTVNSTVGGTTKPTAQVFSLNNNFTTINNSVPRTAVNFTQPVVSSFVTSSNPTQQNFSTLQNPLLGMTSVAKAMGNNNIPLMTPSIFQPNVTPSQHQQSTLDTSLINQLVSGQSASNISLQSNPSSVQSSGTTEITFVNECTAVDHLVSVTGMSQPASNIFTTHPITPTVSTTVSKATAVSSVTQPSVTVGDSDDSDTPLAVVAESLRKASGEDKKKKKRKKGEKRKKKEKSSGVSEK